MNRTTIFAVLSLSLVLGSGCKKITQAATEKAIEEGTGAKKVDIDKGNVEIVGPKGEKLKSGDNVSLPDGWPTSRVPAYPGVKIVSSFSGNNGEMTYMGETTDAPPKVLAFYKDKLSGYKVEGTLNMPQSSMATFKGPNDQITVTASDGSGSGKNVVTVVIGKK